MAEEIPVIPKAGSLLVNSGNIVNWNRLKRKPNQTPSEELCQCLSQSLQRFLQDSDKTELQYVTSISCAHPNYRETVPKDERSDLKLTLKIFLCSLLSPESVAEAIQTVLSDLEVTFVESVIVALPEFDHEELDITVIQPYWKVLEKLVNEEKVLSLGMADLDKRHLEQLFEWAEVKPVVNQVNLESCCVMPKELVEFAKENDIQLLTHNDPKTLLSVESLQSVIRDNSTEKDSENWEPLWVLRYSSLIKNRGIIKSKGYLMRAERDIKKRK